MSQGRAEKIEECAMSRIYTSRPYREKNPTDQVEIERPTGSDLTISERQLVQQMLADRFRTHRLYSTQGGRQRALVKTLH
jgi:hypothetical protein